MKHLFIISLLLSFGFSAFAQTEQGSKFIGGSFGISTASFSNGNNSSTFELSPRFGYFVKDQWTVGSGLGPMEIRMFSSQSRPSPDTIFLLWKINFLSSEKRVSA